jgi:hypothetical protein
MLTIVSMCESVWYTVLPACRSKACKGPEIRTPTYRILSGANYLHSTLTQELPPLIVSTLLCSYWSPMPELQPPYHIPAHQQRCRARIKTKRRVFGIDGKGSRQRPMEHLF